MDHFVAGKETAFFVTFNTNVRNMLLAGDSIYLVILHNGDYVTTLNWEESSASTLYFQPRSLNEVGSWPEGEYTFLLYINDDIAVKRETRFHKSIQMRVLIVPVVTNYGGRIARPTGEWRNAGSLIAPLFPVGRADVDIVLGRELDLSQFDITTDVGQFRVWEALANMQTRNQDYIAIIGIIPFPIEDGNGLVLGYTYGAPASIANEKDPEMAFTVVHEIAHTLKIGDEYPGGHLSMDINPAPFGMSGYDIFTEREVTSRMSQVRGGSYYGMRESGSVVYPEQRAFHVEERRQLNKTTSYMGWGTGSVPNMWVTSDIWLHKFRIFTKIDAGGASGTQTGGDHGAACFQCTECYVFMDDFDIYAQCWTCLNFTYIDDEGLGDRYRCYHCRTVAVVELEELFAYCGTCDWLLWLPEFIEHNSRAFGFNRMVAAPSGYCCFVCDGTLDPVEMYVECWICEAYTSMADMDIGDRFICFNCNTADVIEEDFIYIHCEPCDIIMWYWDFVEFNSHMFGGNASNAALGSAMQGIAARGRAVTAIEIRGLLTDEGFEPYPWFTFETEPSFLDNRLGGDYTIHFFDRNGRQLSVSYFDADFTKQMRTSAGIQMIETLWSPIHLFVRFPDDTHRITIQKGNAVLHSIELTQNAPTVRFTGLRDHQQLGNTVTLTWEAAGERDLFFEIWYVPSEGDYHQIALDVTGRSHTVDLSDLPGTNMGYFYIYASDGVRTAEIDSPWIRVPYKAPLAFTDERSFDVKITEEFSFEIDIYDLQDGWLMSDEVVWYLDGEEFWTGDTLLIWPYELPPGTHVFTVAATNSANLTTKQHFTVNIINDESDLPDDWSRADIIAALSLGFSTDLRRLDMSITRGKYAEFMWLIYVYLNLGEGLDVEDIYYPEYVDGVITDGGHDYYAMYVMVYFGLMDAPNGRFNPQGTLTQHEAATILSGLFDMGGMSLMEFLFEFDIIEPDGPNAFNPEARLTNRLAMVRMARMFE
jgi:hypothetical protein